MKRGTREERSKAANQRWEMRSWPMTASVGTPRKRCISIPTRRKTWRQIGGARGGWLMFPYAAYATSITSILLYLLLYISRHHLCFAAACIRCTAARLHIVACGEFCFISLFFFFFSLFYFDDGSLCMLHVHMLKVTAPDAANCVDITICSTEESQYTSRLFTFCIFLLHKCETHWLHVRLKWEY